MVDNSATWPITKTRVLENITKRNAMTSAGSEVEDHDESEIENDVFHDTLVWRERKWNSWQRLLKKLKRSAREIWQWFWLKGPWEQPPFPLQ
jgi:hypothetical protein